MTQSMADIDFGAIEAIKRLKARYFRLLDTREWAQWADVFTHDIVLEPMAGMVFTGRDEVVRNVSSLLAGATTVHHGHMPEIELTGPDQARGIWAMYDWVDSATQSMQGYGHYHEEYRRDADGAWRISRLTLTRLRMDTLAK